MNIMMGSSLLLNSAGYQISRSVRLRSSANAYLQRTNATTGTDPLKFTVSAWVKKGNTVELPILGSATGSAAFDFVGFWTGDNFVFRIRNSSSVDLVRVESSAVYRDYSAWYHLVAIYDSANATSTERVRLYVNGVRLTAFGTATYPPLNQGLTGDFLTDMQIGRTNTNASNQNYGDGYLTEMNFIDGQALDPSYFGETNAVTGVWQPKKYTGTYGTNGFYLPFNWSSAAAYAGGFNGTSQYLTLASNAAFAPGTGDFTIEAMVNFNTGSGNRPIFQNDVVGISGTDKFYLNYDGTNIVLGRHSTGTSSTAAWTPVVGLWYHIAAVRQSGTVKIFVDGTSLTVTNSTALNGISFGQGGAAIGVISTPMYLNGSISNLRYVVGTAVYTSSFTAPTSNLTAISGTQILTLQNSTIIDNSPNAATITNTGSVTTTLQYPYQYNGIGTDQSGNTNNWTPNNISTVVGTNYDSMLDVPTQWADGGNGRGNYCTLNPIMPGVATGGGAVAGVKDGNLLGGNTGSGGWAIVGSTMAIPSGGGRFYFECTVGASGQSMSVGVQKADSRFTAQYIVGNTGDANGYSYCNDGLKYNNGGTAYASTAAAGDVIGVAVDASSGTSSITFYKNGVSLGSAFTGITGDLLPAMSSTSGSGMCPTNFGQRPFAYTPPSGFTALNTLNLPTPTILKGNQYFDAVTYAGSASQQTITTALTGLDFAWIKNRTTARDHVLVDTVRGGSPLLTLYSDLTAAEDNTSPNYNPTSFTTSGIVLGGAKLGINNAGENFVLWGWKEGATQGFDIVTFTGDGSSPKNIAHNLGVAPRMIIIKSRNNVSGWNSYHASLGNTQQINLQSTAAATTSIDWWNNTSPTSSQFTIGANININGWTFVAYLFAAVAGYSAFGSYTGNGSADGPFVFLGFRPRFVMWKNASAAEAWLIEDTARSTYNEVALELYPSSSGAEAAGSSRSPTQQFDYLSNGFKVRGAQSQTNGNGNTIIYAAFAENPFKNALAR